MQLSKKQILVTGSALFAMFVGAGNLIFPPMLGFNAGTKLWSALAGFIITGVGLPLLGVTAVAKAGGDLQYLANRVHPYFSKIITTIVILAIGPMLAIPRTAATTFEVSIAPFLTNSPVSSSLILFVTSLIFFLLTLFFVLRPTKIIEDVGKFLTPFIIVFLCIIIFKGILLPAGEVNISSYTNPFSEGFLEGYNTMDALASVIFGIVIANSIKAKGITDNNEIARITILAGIIAAIGLASIYIGLAYLGATTGQLFTKDNPGQMLSFVTETLLGQSGKIIIAITMALACLTTAIGLTSSCGAFFNRLTKNKISYNNICIITAIISTILTNMGLEKILEVSSFLLVTIYPIIIVLILLALLHNLFKGKRTVYIAVVSGTATVVIANTINMLAQNRGINLYFLNMLLSYLPLYEQGLSWMIPAIIFAILGLIVKDIKKPQDLN